MERLRRSMTVMVVFGPGGVVFVVMFWPQLWEAPVSRFLDTIGRLVEPRPFEYSMPLFSGESLSVSELSWNHFPMWTSITIPPVTGILFVVGCGVVADQVGKAPLPMGSHQPLAVRSASLCCLSQSYSRL